MSASGVKSVYGTISQWRCRPVTTLHMPRTSPRVSAVAEAVREVFWVVALGIIGCYVFFVALGAFSPGEVAGVSIAVAILLALWLVHAWTERHRSGPRDPRVTSGRERRGF
jgi:membrane protein implicated in regulation of membrane protease activity